MTEEQLVEAYVRSVRRSLLVPREERVRALEEIETHLADSIAAHRELGHSNSEAFQLAADELGPPEVVAARFNDDHRTGSTNTGIRRWVPMILPLLLLIANTLVVIWNLRWLPGGMSTGEQLVLRASVFRVLVMAAVTSVAYLSIKRSRSDLAWRWGAWLSTAAALLILLKG